MLRLCRRGLCVVGGTFCGFCFGMMLVGSSGWWGVFGWLVGGVVVVYWLCLFWLGGVGGFVSFGAFGCVCVGSLCVIVVGFLGCV